MRRSPATSDAPEFTADMKAAARVLWLTGMPGLAICAAVGCNKNQLVGHAHRAGWPKRPNPIKGAASAKPRPSRAITKSGSGAATPAVISPEAAVARAAAAPQPAGAVEVPIVTRSARAATGCCWPIGEPRQPGFRFCDAPVQTRGKPYCGDCAAVAYTARHPYGYRASSVAAMAALT